MTDLPNFLSYTQNRPGIEKYTFKLGNGKDHFTLSYVAKKKIFNSPLTPKSFRVFTLKDADL
jgi:hypothetical protein